MLDTDNTRAASVAASCFDDRGRLATTSAARAASGPVGRHTRIVVCDGGPDIATRLGAFFDANALDAAEQREIAAALERDSFYLGGGAAGEYVVELAAPVLHFGERAR